MIARFSLLLVFVLLLLAACNGENHRVTPDAANEPLPGENGEAAAQQATDDARPDLEVENQALREEVERLRVLLQSVRTENRGLQDEVEGLHARLRSPSGNSTPRPQPIGTVEGLEDALRVYLPDLTVDWRPGVTAWNETDLSLPRELTDPRRGLASPGLLTLRLTEAVVGADEFGGTPSEPGFPWEVTSRILVTSEEDAVAVVQQWGGLYDDSVAGIDYMFELRRGSAGWHVSEVVERSQCHRSGRGPGEEKPPEVCT